MANNYDVVIVGGGPAGIFTALEITQSSNLTVLLLEKGQDLAKRKCPSHGNHRDCRCCDTCSAVSGWGGAGAFSDGKLTLSTEIGGILADYQGVPATEDLVRYVDRLYLDFGAPDTIYGIGPDVARFQKKASEAGLRMIPMAVRHLGTERCFDILAQMRQTLSDRVEVKTGVSVRSIRVKGGRVVGIQTKDGTEIKASYLVVAPGREGSDWLVDEADELGLTRHNNPIDIGVRVELPKVVLSELTDVLYECKLEYYSQPFRDRVRTFCMCPAGEVTMESTGGEDPVTTVNGHSYADRETENTNFAVLCSALFPPPFTEPISYGRSVARLANLLSGGVILQRLGDLFAGRCSFSRDLPSWAVFPTLGSARPGDLTAALPYRFLTGVTQMLTAMDKLAPGVASADTLLYGTEVKFYSSRLQLTNHLETEITNLFAIGDGAGVSRGLVQASASGVVAAREILRRATSMNS